MKNIKFNSINVNKSNEVDVEDNITNKTLKKIALNINLLRKNNNRNDNKTITISKNNDLSATSFKHKVLSPKIKFSNLINYKLSKPNVTKNNSINKSTNKSVSKDIHSERNDNKNEKTINKHKTNPFPLINNNFFKTFSSRISPKKNKTTNVEYVNIMSIMDGTNIPIELSNLELVFPDFEKSKCSVKPVGVISAYGVNTYQGIIRNYNEDRVSIILNISKPSEYQGVWPRCSFFGIYDGHGGHKCADFLRDYLHAFIIKDPNFPFFPEEAIKRGFEAAEKEFIETIAIGGNGELLDKSGSCALIAIFMEDKCYIGNLGDSRAVLSKKKIDHFLTNDHKPGNDNENQRIIINGGKIYQSTVPSDNGIVYVGPYRVLPGRLSVCRTFGDVEAKLPHLGGIKGVVIAEPEISIINISSETDFIVMGCDGIFDQMSNKEVIDSVWLTLENKQKNIHQQVGNAVDMIMKSSLARKTLDNVTCIIIAFENFENIYTKTPIHCDINMIDEYYCNTDTNQHNLFNKYNDISTKIDLSNRAKVKINSPKLQNLNYHYLSKNMKKLEL